MSRESKVTWEKIKDMGTGLLTVVHSQITTNYTYSEWEDTYSAWKERTQERQHQNVRELMLEWAGNPDSKGKRLGLKTRNSGCDKPEF